MASVSSHTRTVKNTVLPHSRLQSISQYSLSLSVSLPNTQTDTNTHRNKHSNTHKKRYAFWDQSYWDPTYGTSKNTGVSQVNKTVPGKHGSSFCLGTVVVT